MPKSTTIFLALISLSAFAQKPSPSLEKLGLKHLQSQVSYIPPKTFTSLVYRGSDSVSTYRSRNSSVEAFYISKTEVTNREYREFVHYTRDSIAHRLLSHFTGDNAIDWKQPIDWKDKRLDGIMVTLEESNFGKREIDPRKIIYALDFFGRTETISIYPDTLIWIRDFKFSNNEPLVKNYFAYADYDKYPVVGVTLKQALAFCQWKTQQLRGALKMDEAAKVEVTLPTNSEWESAAFDIRDTTFLETRNKKYYYNFGNIVDGNRTVIKTYKDDGYFYTAPAKSYKAGLFGLFDMKGNVAEWTVTSLEEVMNAELKPGKQKSVFVAKGGGWNSTPFYLQAGACQFLPVDAAHSYIGFRYVVHTAGK